MGPTLAIGFGAAIIVGISLFVIALWLHKKAGAGEVKLLGEPGVVETKLDPEGTVIVGGELWRAKSNDGSLIGENVRVRVIGMQGHLVMVEACQNHLR